MSGAQKYIFGNFKVIWKGILKANCEIRFRQEDTHRMGWRECDE